MHVELGDKARDTVSGFEGIVVGQTEWLNGCVRYCLQPPVKDGEFKEQVWVDEEQVVQVEAEAWKSPRRGELREATGGDRSTPPRTGSR